MDGRVDIYSLCMILWELQARAKPFEGENFMTATMNILQGTRPAIPAKTPSGYSKVIKKCWDADPKARHTLEAILSFFDGELGAEMDV